MRNKKINVLIGAIAIMMVALTIVQLVWLQLEFSANRKDIDMRVAKSMQLMATEISTTQYCAPTFSKAFIEAGEQVFLIHKKQLGGVDTLQMFYDEKYSTDSLVGRVNSLKFRHPFKLEVALNAMILESDINSFIKSKNDFEEAKGTDRLKKIISNTQSIDSLLDMESIFSTIKKNLKFDKIDTNFSFALVNNENDHLSYFSKSADRSPLLKTKFSTPIFSNNPFMQNYFLHLHLPQVYSENRMSLFNLLPLFIILLLLSTLIIFARLFLKQIHLDKLKSNFIHNMAHELNTPLANISLALETLANENETKNDKTKTLLNIISAESGRLHENIEKSLHFARMEDSSFHLRKETIDIVDLINTVLISYRYKCQELGGDIYFDFSNPVELIGDETHILNSIVNILDNAVKYRNGKPIIHIAVKETNDTIEIEIKDNGLGMNSTALKHIFDKFYRVDEGSEHNTRGFGLGLSYVKNIMDLHDGKILVRSKLGSGSTFILQFKNNKDNG